MRRVIRRLLRLSRAVGRDAEREVDEEIRAHLALRKAQLEEEGQDAASAAAEAGRRFARDAGAVRALYAAARERDRRMHVRERWESVVQDGRHAVRSLGRDRLVVVFITVALGLGAGATVTALSLFDRLVVRGPEHIRDGAELVRLYSRIANTTTGTQTSSWIPWPNYLQLDAGLTTLEAVGAYRVSEMVTGRGEEARRIRVGQTTGAFFDVLGAQPLRGRFFSVSEDASTAGPLAILGEGLWRSEYGADPGVSGRSVVIGDVPHTIVGVAPAGFTGTQVRRVDAWVLSDARRSGQVNWHIVGRRRPGVTEGMVSEEAAAVHRRTSAAGPVWMQEAVLFAASIRNDETGREPFEATMTRWLAAISCIILLIAFANVVNLQLGRLARRRRELGVRAVLGSGRARLMRLVAFEGVVLALAGGTASLLVVRLLEPVVRTALFADEAGWRFTLVDVRVVGLVVLVVGVTGCVVGLIPALQAGDPRLTAWLRAGTRSAESHSAVRSALTVVQTALSVVLLAGAGLFIRSLANVRALDLGADAERVVTVTAELPVSPLRGIRDYIETERTSFRRYLEAVRRLPGVERASIAVGLPFDGGSYSAGVWVPGADSAVATSFAGPYVSVVAGEYFATVGTAIMEGREFTDADREGSEPVVIVGGTMARAFWPGGGALGSCVRIGSPGAACARVVGVAADIHRVGLREEPSLQYYIPLGQTGMFGGASLVVRPSAASPVAWPALRQAILNAEPAVRFVEIAQLGARLDPEKRPLRLGMVAFGISGGLALLVAVLGLYSLMSYMVSWRTHEIGIRVALGATDTRITRLVVGNGTTLAAIGVIIGLALASIGGRWLEPHLFDTSAIDPLVLVAVATALPGVALLAGWLPARRALHISPTEALRTD